MKKLWSATMDPGQFTILERENLKWKILIHSVGQYFNFI